MSNEYLEISQREIAEIANIMPTTLRKNIYLLLRVALKSGFSLKIDVAEKMNNIFLTKMNQVVKH